MQKTEYLDLIKVATSAPMLNGLREDARNDQSLHVTDKDEIHAAIDQRFAAMNARHEAEKKITRGPRWSRKVLPILIFAVACLICSSHAGTIATTASASRCELIVSPLTTLLGRRLANFVGCNAATAAVTPERLKALSMVETGDHDNAVGACGEVSRYQIRPGVWKQYFAVWCGRTNYAALCRAAATNPITASNVAAMIMHDRCQAFATRRHRQPTDAEFYILWNRPAVLLAHAVMTPRLEYRAVDFANLVQKDRKHLTPNHYEYCPYSK